MPKQLYNTVDHRDARRAIYAGRELTGGSIHPFRSGDGVELCGVGHAKAYGQSRQGCNRPPARAAVSRPSSICGLAVARCRAVYTDERRSVRVGSDFVSWRLGKHFEKFRIIRIVGF